MVSLGGVGMGMCLDESMSQATHQSVCPCPPYLQLAAVPGWSNGRDVGTWTKRIFRTYAARSQGHGSSGSAGGLLGSSSSSSMEVSLLDLEASLEDFIRSKTLPEGSGAAGSRAAGAGGRGLPPMAPAPAAHARAPPVASPAAATAAAAPADLAVGMEVDEEDEAAEAPLAPATDAAADGFGGLSDAFLKAMQDGLESLGYDLAAQDIMEQLASDPSVPGKLLPFLAASGVTDANVLREMVRQWQQALERQMEQERQAKRKGQRPIWRCRACGRYGCPVAPYIEGYQEFEM